MTDSTPHRFQPGQFVKAKSSGKFYRIARLRSDDHPKLKGEIGYSVIGRRDGKDFGPIRLLRESSFELTAYCSE